MYFVVRHIVQERSGAVVLYLKIWTQLQLLHYAIQNHLGHSSSFWSMQYKNHPWKQAIEHRSNIETLTVYLDSGVADVADFLTVESFPLPLVESGHERHDKLGLHHVDEGISHVALIFEVDGKIKEVILAAELLVYCLEQHLLCILVGNVLDHQSCPWIFACNGNSVSSWQNQGAWQSCNVDSAVMASARKIA